MSNICEPTIRTIFDQEFHSYFQYIMCVHCDDDSAINLDEDQAHSVLYDFTERLNQTITCLTKLNNRSLHIIVDHLAIETQSATYALDEKQRDYVITVFATRVKIAIDKVIENSQ